MDEELVSQTILTKFISEVALRATAPESHFEWS